MNKLQHPHSIFRSTLDKLEGAPLAGIYVIAYMGSVLYVGKASYSAVERIENHLRNLDPVGLWMRRVDDWPNVRVDILEIPHDFPVLWLERVEAALVQRFRPLFNTSLQPAATIYQMEYA